MKQARADDLTGETFGRWTVLHRVTPVGEVPIMWTCRCSCPDETVKDVDVNSLRRGMSTSCGCFQREDMARRRTKHGRSAGQDPTYGSWAAMRDRCHNVQSSAYRNYGGRGITVCDRWCGDDGFKNFLEDMDERPQGQSLGRLNDATVYSKETCAWQTDVEQMRSRRDGLPKALRERIALRLRNGDSQEEIAKRFGVGRRVVRGIKAEDDGGVSPRYGVATHPLYGLWAALWHRCRHAPRYVDRGITVCPRWQGKGGFQRFSVDVGDRPSPEHSVDRIDNNGNYCAATCGGLCGHAVTNVRWATPSEQMLNREGVRQFTSEETTAIVTARAAGTPMSILGRQYGVGWQVIKRVLRDASAAGATDVTATNTTAVELLAAFRRDGFPWSVVAVDEVDPVARVRKAGVTVDGDVIHGVGFAGQRTCLVAHPHRLEARHNGQLSVVEAFHDDATLLRAIRYQQDCGDSTTPAAVVRALRALVRAPHNFPPVLARWLVDAYAPDGGVVLDPCAGYGGRLLGTLASVRNLRYVGFDIEPRTVEGNGTLVARLGISDRAVVTCRDAVSGSVWPTADLVLTGPPYFNVEDYGPAARATAPSTYEAWRDGFLRDLITRALTVAPTVILNVAAVGKHDLPADAVEIVKKLGGKVARTLRWRLPGFGGSRREEKILVIRR